MHKPIKPNSYSMALFISSTMHFDNNYYKVVHSNPHKFEHQQHVQAQKLDEN